MVYANRMLPTHPIINFINAKNGNNALVHIKKDVDDETYNMVSAFLDENFNRNGKNNQWFVKTDEAEDLCQAIDEILEDVDEDESDDELIQEALARRFKSQSSNKSIEDEKVDDSEDEDVVSISRRLRHLYKTIKDLNERINRMEANGSKQV